MSEELVDKSKISPNPYVWRDWATCLGWYEEYYSKDNRIVIKFDSEVLKTLEGFPLYD